MEDKEGITTQEATERLDVTTARKMGGKYRGQWQIKSSDVENVFIKRE